jgi:hypothetical protein
MLPELCYLACTSIVIAIWPDEIQQSRRAWCVCEAAIGQAVTGYGVPVPIDSLGTFSADADPDHRGAVLVREMTMNTKTVLGELQQIARSAEHPSVLKSWFKSRGIVCTHEQDLDIVAAAVFAAMFPMCGLRGVSIMTECLSRIVGIIWTIVSLPVFVLYPISAVALRIGNSEYLAPRAVSRWGIAARLPLVFIIGLLYGGPMMLSALVPAPVEKLRKYLKRITLKAKGRYVAECAAHSAAIQSDRPDYFAETP